jgi:nitroreductase
MNPAATGNAVAEGKPDTAATALERLHDGCRVARFEPEPVPGDILEWILEAGCRTSSPWNLKPWQFIQVRSEITRAQLLRHCLDPGPAATAPVLLVGVGNPRAWKQAPERLAEMAREGGLAPGEEAVHLERIRRQWSVGDAARVFAIALTHAALQQLTAAAAVRGVCSHWVYEFDADALARVLHLPESLLVVGVLGLGYCSEPRGGAAASLERCVFGEAYGLPRRPASEVKHP